MLRIWKEQQELGRISEGDRKAGHRVTESGLGEVEVGEAG